MDKSKNEKRMYFFMHFMSILFYISNIALFVIARQFNGNFNVKTRYAIIINALVLIELVVLCVNSAMINPKIEC